AAHAGNRRPHGARRESATGVVAGRAAIVRAARDWAPPRHGRGVRRGAAAAIAAGADESKRSGDAVVDRSALRRGLARRLLLAGAARHASRSGPRAPL